MVASGGTVGIVIPPSITMVVYGSIANTSIADLFIAGFAPGILMGVSMCVVSWVISKRNGYQGEGHFSVMRILRSFRECFWALMMPVIILGGIYTGIFTPTEAAAVAAVYGALVGFFIYRELTLAHLPKTLLSAAYNTTMIMFVVGAANLFGWILTNAQVPHMLAQSFATLTDSPIVFLMLVNVLLLFIGTLINASAAVVILTPILLPVATGMGIDPMFFGVLMVVNPGHRLHHPARGPGPLCGGLHHRPVHRQGHGQGHALSGHAAGGPGAADLLPVHHHLPARSAALTKRRPEQTGFLHISGGSPRHQKAAGFPAAFFLAFVFRQISMKMLSCRVKRHMSQTRKGCATATGSVRTAKKRGFCCAIFTLNRQVKRDIPLIAHAGVLRPFGNLAGVLPLAAAAAFIAGGTVVILAAAVANRAGGVIHHHFFSVMVRTSVYMHAANQRWKKSNTLDGKDIALISALRRLPLVIPGAGAETG